MAEPKEIASDVPSSSDPRVDLDEARRFLALLGAKSPTFQTFDDNAGRKNRDLARVLHGQLDDHADQLTHLNELGAGVFVGMNLTDRRGRKKENIRKIRAVALDLDGGPLEPVRLCRLPPHLIVESSPGRHHAYWIVKGLPLDRFEDVQRSIAKRFDGDPQIAKLTHVARLPGFFHSKGDPFRSRLIEENDLPPYTAEQIIAEFPPEAKPHKPPTSMAGRTLLFADNPVASVEKFIGSHFRTAEGVCTLYHFRGSYYQWVGSHFAEMDEKALRSLLYGYLKKAITITRQGHYEEFKPTGAKVSAVLDALESYVYLESRQPPFWLGSMAHADAAGLIACENGLVDIEKNALLPHTPYFFNVNALPFSFDPEAPTPREWLRFLKQLWPDDDEARGTLRRIFGLLLTGDTSFQKIFMIIGPRRSGKGTLARILTALLGRDNVANPTLAGLSSHFGLSALINKQVAIISDARLGPAANAHTVVERLLSISGEDGQTIDRKYRDPWTGSLGVRFVILTNEVPRFADASGALASRFIILTLKRSFYGKEDRQLTEKLLKELPGILNWSLRGLDQLREDGRFVMPESSTEVIEQLEELASPVAAFVREWCDVAPSNSINVKELWAAYAVWCESEGHRPGSQIVFGRNLRALLPQLRTKNRGAGRTYVGLGLNAEGADRYLESKKQFDRYGDRVR